MFLRTDQEHYRTSSQYFCGLSQFCSRGFMSLPDDLQLLYLLTLVPGVQEVVAAVARGGAEAAAAVARAVPLPLQATPPDPAPAPPRVTRVTRAA